MVAGAATALAIAVATDQVPDVPVVAYGIAAITALLPDLDQGQAMANRVPGVRYTIGPILRQARHRQETHSILGWAVFTLIAFGIVEVLGDWFGEPLSPALWWAASAGWASHIVADMFNKQGVGLFAPFARGRFEWISVPVPRALRISTVTDPTGPPITLGRMQAHIPTERLFFRWPAYAALTLLVLLNAGDFFSAVGSDVEGLVEAMPGAVATAAGALGK